ncbi:MAG: alpha/beta fold hydrolase [Verrucomicrobiota bacterium]|nr:alpha/beta fold hydrolase [Verrucomicrobiota bacterium]
MQKYQRTTIFLLLFLCVPSIWAASPLDGDWIGGFDRPKSRVFVHVHFGTANDGTTGTIDVIDMAYDPWATDKPLEVNPIGLPVNSWVMGKPLDKLDMSASRIHFELADKARPLSFNGEVTNGVMTGVVEDRGMRLPFRLDLMAKINRPRYAGIYRLGPRHFITIAPFNISLFCFDTKSGQIRVLLPHAGADFVCGSGTKIYPVQAAIHFTTNQLGQVTAMQWKPNDAPALVGTRIKPLPEEDVSFTNGNVTLSGTLVLPPTKSPHPAVVLVSGAGANVRSAQRIDADFFALNGVAALIYDKRGCGASTGDWRKSGFDDLAGDALAWVKLLKTRPEISPHQIGLWGESQGGWIVSLAASRSKDVAFIISVSGPGITPQAQGAYCAERWMKAAGYSENDVREAVSLYLLTSRCTRTGSGWDELKAARNADQNKPWYNVNPFVRGVISPGADKQWQRIWNYDPVPALCKVHCPVLAIFGKMDSLVPAQKSADIWKAALTKAGNHDVVIKIFPHANRGINDTRTWMTLPGFFTLQRNWLLKRVTVNN